MSLIAEPIEIYAQRNTTPQPAWMEVIEQDARASLENPQMLSGGLVGRFLELMVHAVQARQVLEIGTYAGYSTLAMAAGLPAGGRIITCELSAEHAAFARERIAASPYAEQIELHVAPALKTIAGLSGPFDFIFIDAEKTGYSDYYDAVIDKLSPHGLIAADNTLFGGRALDPDSDSDSATAIRAFNEKVRSDPRVIAVMLTVRDGITLIRRR